MIPGIGLSKQSAPNIVHWQRDTKQWSLLISQMHLVE
jgi:hypothetical protein